MTSKPDYCAACTHHAVPGDQHPCHHCEGGSLRQCAPITHAAVWAAIDALAQRNGLTASGLAIRSGMDPNAFSPSGRRTREGKDRWLNVQTIARVLKATGRSFTDFARLVDEAAARGAA